MEDPVESCPSPCLVILQNLELAPYRVIWAYVRIPKIGSATFWGYAMAAGPYTPQHAPPHISYTAPKLIPVGQTV